MPGSRVSDRMAPIGGLPGRTLGCSRAVLLCILWPAAAGYRWQGSFVRLDREAENGDH